MFITIGENASYAFMPDAGRAFNYGERHFDSKYPEFYDVDKAERFFRYAAQHDQSIQYINHELARIAFLRGKFDEAMWYINRQIDLHGTTTPNSYYVRGLIEGYRGEYAEAAQDYEFYLTLDPRNWAAINDYAWILLKAHRARDAVVASARGLALAPLNPWLLNTNAIALYEIREKEAARDQAKKAVAAVLKLTESEWLHAYPGNDPQVAEAGLLAFKDATIKNMHTILLASSSHEVQ